MRYKLAIFMRNQSLMPTLENFNKIRKMAKQLTTNLRKSSSLIIICKDQLAATKSSNYKVLLFNRHENATFMPNQAVFPGGVCETSDESPLWRQYFLNYKSDKVNISKFIKDEQTDVNKCGYILPRDLDLRITAIRETFEEVGILLCQDHKSINDEGLSNNYECPKGSFDRECWQHLVHNDSSKFLSLCKELDVVPDVFNLEMWSNWITPSTFQKRFDTTFYTVLLQDCPQVLIEKSEVNNYEWKTPQEFLNDHYNKKCWLPPPQIYELSRLLNFNDFSDLKEFLQNKQKSDNTLGAPLLPVQFKCVNGVVSLLPGDQMYPNDPIASNEMIPIDKSIEHFRKDAKHLHRFEFYNPHDCIIRINMESPVNHIYPINGNLQRN